MAYQLVPIHQDVTHVGSIKIDRGNIDKFLEALRACWIAVCMEPEWVYFDVFHSQCVHAIEVWVIDSGGILEC